MGAIDDLAKKLRDAYDGAPASRKVVSIHLFGITHASALQGVSKHDVAERAGLPRSYGAELNKAANLAEYVQVTKPLA